METTNLPFGGGASYSPVGSAADPSSGKRKSLNLCDPVEISRVSRKLWIASVVKHVMLARSYNLRRRVDLALETRLGIEAGCVRREEGWAPLIGTSDRPILSRSILEALGYCESL